MLMMENNNRHSYKPMVQSNKEFFILVCSFKAYFP